MIAIVLSIRGVDSNGNSRPKSRLLLYDLDHFRRLTASEDLRPILRYRRTPAMTPASMNPSPDIFPPTARWVLSFSPPVAPRLDPEEWAHTPGMTQQRLLQFSHGRLCARAALTLLGIPSQAIPVGRHREPQWPQDVVGSITHAEHRAAAVVGAIADFAGLGIDLETATPLDDDITPSVCTDIELDYVRSGDAPPAAGKLIFSIKESIFKCLWPLVGRFIDFREIEVTVLPREREFRAKSINAEDLEIALRHLNGRYEYMVEGIVTGAWIRAVTNTVAASR
jgi:4'-phosphopantetheinyl transferase EntD